MDDTLKLSSRDIKAGKRLSIALPVPLSQILQVSLAIICAFVFMTLLTVDAAFQGFRGLPPSLDEL